LPTNRPKGNKGDNYRWSNIKVRHISLIYQHRQKIVYKMNLLIYPLYKNKNVDIKVSANEA